MKPLDSKELRRAGLLLFGPDRGWQSRMAESLGVDRASVSRYLAGSTIPGPVAAAIRSWLKLHHLTGETPRAPRPYEPRFSEERL